MKNITFSKHDSRFENPDPKAKKNFKKKNQHSSKKFSEIGNDEILAELGDTLSLSDDLSKEVKELEDFMSDKFSIVSEIQKKDHSVYTKRSEEHEQFIFFF
jgi:hypothetical protein